jgi:hypothetical protein
MATRRRCEGREMRRRRGHGATPPAGRVRLGLGLGLRFGLRFGFGFGLGLAHLYHITLALILPYA